MENMDLDPIFWRDQRVLLTGHTGFKGAWLSLWLQQWNVQVHGYALAPHTVPSLYQLAQINSGMSETIADINDATVLRTCFEQFQPTIVLHLAAQAIVATSYEDPISTWRSNVLGTQQVLENIRHCGSVKAAVIVTTDKVYKNTESGAAFVESDALGGHDPYSASKAACELLCQSYRHSFLSHVPLACARAGNVIGGGDFAAHRLIPDVIRAWSEQKAIAIRQPQSVRPWQHVFESLQGYLRLAQALATHKTQDAAWNFGPPIAQCCTVSEMLEQLKSLWPNNGGVELTTSSFSEAGLLMLNSGKAEQELRWRSIWDLDRSLQKSLAWYQAWRAGKNMHEFSVQQLNDYFQDLTG